MASSLGSCVSSLRSTNALLSSSISILDNGHFELLPESSLHTAQSQLLGTLTPELESLLNRISTHLDKLERREQALIARSELLEGRIGEERRASAASGGWGARGSGGLGKGREPSSVGMKGESKEALRLKQARAKKERLSYAVERLTLQAQQRERQLRMSIAAT
ncbi:uncharacterized protein KY384_001144 [Bacidia gigantensis]|uniref:uncharacterized protein n=1 Tax=Bacidia gigantensis TaxID=2732470 RepID=UPI001D052BA1|nr:uncharacterized protein KY384_001144 [Bacidia gigantensis]KAG8534300.1 hypothetical protein KY384_001144 [Bacidia gigantensis]